MSLNLWMLVSNNRTMGGIQHNFDIVEGPYLGNVTKALKGKDPKWYGHQLSIHDRSGTQAIGKGELLNE